VFLGQRSEGDLRFTRVWARSAETGAWQVAVAHSTLIPS
jgi:hypothetical protein